jgi:large subunit ribosomal protein L21
MYAVFQLSGFQYSVSEGDVIRVPRQAAEEGGALDISEVLMVNDGENAHIGRPFVENAKVEAEVLGQGKDDKVLIYKYKRRTKYRRRQGHRQDYTELKINRIVAPQS